MKQLLKKITFKNHPILGNLELEFTNKEGHVFKNIVFVGENGTGKTTILKEIDNYNFSNYIVNKVSSSIKSKLIFQDIKYREVLKVIANKIDGSFDDVYGDGCQSLYEQLTELNCGNIDNLENTKKTNFEKTEPRIEIKDILELQNGRIEKACMNGITLNVFLKNAVSKVKITNENENSNYIDNYCSGEQEILLRLLDIAYFVNQHTDVVLIDEPETSLHPKWQYRIVEIYKKILRDIIKSDDWQLFIATHSENILSSVIADANTLIIRLYKEKDIVKAAYLTNMDRVLPTISFHEIQYVVFDICSSDYHNQLFGYFFKKTHNSSLRDVDKKISDSDVYDRTLDRPCSFRANTYYTLPVYVRNAIHHPEDEKLIYNENDLRRSIDILRKIIKKT